MTVVWFVVWLIADNVGGREPLRFEPVNWWAVLLLLAVALDLSAAHAHDSLPSPSRRPRRPRADVDR